MEHKHGQRPRGINDIVQSDSCMCYLRSGSGDLSSITTTVEFKCVELNKSEMKGESYYAAHETAVLS